MKDGLTDWDCEESLSISDMESALNHIHETGTFPVSDSSDNIPTPSSRRLSHRSDHGCCPPILSTGPSSSPPPPSQSFIASKEDQNSIGQCPVPDDVISQQKTRVHEWLSTPRGQKVFSSGLSLCVLDGFLLYTPALSSIMSRLDIKLFLLVSRARATQRREARDGYVTLEGFWKDPPGYVDKIVWPNYAKSHAWLFEGGDVEGQLKVDVLEKERIKAQVGKGLDVDMSTTLEWAVGTVISELERMVGEKEETGERHSKNGGGGYQ